MAIFRPYLDGSTDLLNGFFNDVKSQARPRGPADVRSSKTQWVDILGMLQYVWRTFSNVGSAVSIGCEYQVVLAERVVKKFTAFTCIVQRLMNARPGDLRMLRLQVELEWMYEGKVHNVLFNRLNK